MKKAIISITVISVALVLLSFFYTPATNNAAGFSFKIDTLATNLIVPWDITFLPDGTMLFTERPGRVRVYRNKQLNSKPALTLFDIEVKGKMGLLGLCVQPDFDSKPFVYLAYNYRVNDQTFIRVNRYRFVNDSLIEPTLIIENIPGVFNHTGCRLKFGPDKKLYVTTGDADVPKLAQDLKALNGKILRLNEDGTIPADNPFVHNDTARHEIFTYGHRNSQGVSFQPGTGNLFNSEHGPTGGDEINLVQKGNNYGWPIIHHRDIKEGMISPLLEFTPSIGPAEALFYTGDAFPYLKGNLLVACMRGEAILRIRLNGKKILAHDFLLQKMFGRIRALAEGPDGYLYISTSQIDPPESNVAPGSSVYDMILRLRPAGAETGALSYPKQLAADAPQTAVATTNNGSKKDSRSAPVLYSQLCASCHGTDLNGTTKAQSLLDNVWQYGGSKQNITTTISNGVVKKGMPAWEGVLTAEEISRMADFILKKKKAKSKVISDEL